MNDYPAFEVAVARFQAFLRSEGLPEAIIWINPEDVALVKRQICIRPPSTTLIANHISSDYLDGCREGLGVEFGVLCRVDDRIFCFLYVPRDEDESVRHLMPSGLKLSHPVPVPTGLVMEGWLDWQFARWLSRRHQAQINQLFHREITANATR